MAEPAENRLFGELLIEVLPRLRRFAISLTGSRDRGDDLVQTACAKAMAGRKTWRQETRFDAWIFRILRNAWIDELRRRSAEGQPADLDDHEAAASTDGEALAVNRITLDSVLTAVKALPPDQRDVVVLVCVEEFTYAEVAEMTGVPIGTIMSRLARAREKSARLTGIESKPQRQSP